MSESDGSEQLLSDSSEDVESNKTKKPGKLKFTRKQKHVLTALVLSESALYTAMSILAPFFPAEASRRGVSTTVSGLVFSVYALVVFLVSPLVGILIRNFGMKRVMCNGIAVAGICNILFGFSHRLETPTTFATYCFTVRSIEGIGAAAYTTALYAYIAKVFPNDIGIVLGLCSVGTGVGISAGPVIGGVLYDLGGFGLPFYFLGICFFLIAPLSMVLLPPAETGTLSPDKISEESSFKAFLNLTMQIPVFLMSTVVLVISVMWNFLEPTLEFHLREFHFSAMGLSLFFLLMSVVYTVANIVVGYISDRVRRKWIITFGGLTLCCISLLILGPADFMNMKSTIPSNALGISLFAMSYSFAQLPTFELMMECAGSDANQISKPAMNLIGQIGGLCTSLNALGEVIGPALGSYLTEHYGFVTCSTIMAGYCLISASAVLFYFTQFHGRSIQKQKPFQIY